MVQVLFALLAVGLYLTAATSLTLRLLRRPEGPSVLRPASLGAAVAGAALHAVVVWQITWTATGLNLSFFNAASLIGWLTTVLLLLTAVREPVENLGILVLPLTALALALSLTFGHTSTLEPIAAGVDVHILLSIVAYSLLGIAAAQAIALAIQERQLRHRHPGGFMRMLPPLQTMEELLFGMLRFGFAVLTLALISGWMFVEDLFAQHLIHKTVLSMVAWLVFAILLWGRYRFGWRGQTAAGWTLGGFAALMLAYFGSKFVLELILQG